MKFNPNNFYHVYNRGNNRQKIFLKERNYYFFQKKIKEYISPICSILSYCLMPNHFHLLIYVNDHEATFLPSAKMQILERKIGTLQSSYTRAINNQENKTGSLFQPKCKILELTDAHAFTCFHYIHQNPVKAGLTNKLEGWKFSSYNEYLQSSQWSFCAKEVAYSFLNIPRNVSDFIRHSNEVVVDEKVIFRVMNSKDDKV